MKNISNKIPFFKYENPSTVNELYFISLKSLPVAIIVALLGAILLYGQLGSIVIIWSMIITLFLAYRIYMGYMFRRDVNRYTMEVWYKKFVTNAIITALLFGIASPLFMPYVDAYHQIFTVTLILGLSLGATTSLHVDFRLAITYISLILLPAIFSLFYIISISTFLILPISLIVYFIAQVMIISNFNEQKIHIDTLKKDHNVLHNLFRESPLSMFSFNKDLELIDSNKQFEVLFGHEHRELIGTNLKDLPDTRPLNAMIKALTNGSQNYSGSYNSIKGKYLWIEANIFPFISSDNEVMGAIGIIEDKTKERDAIVKLEHLSTHDSLTELLNRRGFQNYMQSLIQEEKHNEYYSLLYYLDLNQFKGINDSLGHKVGDEVLLSVSHRLKYTMHNACSISRLGGDEFIIVVPCVSKSKMEAHDHARLFGHQIKEIFNDPFIIDDLHLHMQSSIGIIIIEPKYSNVEEIIRHADITMYQAKNNNTHISYYDEELDKKQKALFVLQHDLAYAAENDQLDMFFQPIVRMCDDKLIAAEALVRWEHPERGMLNPADFIPLAIKAGLLSNITWWIIERVCKVIRSWKDTGVWHLNYVSININAQQLIEQNFAKEFLNTLKKYGIKTSDIMIEITERSLIDSFDSTQNVINELRQHGIKCAIDDFGIGYSSLSYLKKLSFNTLKIDRDFVKDIVEKSDELRLVKTILDIGRQFEYNIIIEGIEDKKQKELLLSLDDKLNYQGFYFSKPIHANAFRENFLI